MVAWFTLVIFGRLYTVLMCDVPEWFFSSDALCLTWINDIPTYLWFEIAVYGPLLWFALYRINSEVFSQPPTDPRLQARHRRLRLLGTTAAAVCFYGVGIHASDAVEVFVREKGVSAEGDLYDIAYFLDEGLSHYVQFLSLFFLIGWFVIFDRAGRTVHPAFAVFLGVAHGVERALGIIEGEKWFLGPVFTAWIATAATLRARRVGAAAAGDFFFRYAVAFIVTMPLCQLLYLGRFGDFTAPSNLTDGDYEQVAAGSLVVGVAVWLALLALDRLRVRVATPLPRGND